MRASILQLARVIDALGAVLRLCAIVPRPISLPANERHNADRR